MPVRGTGDRALALFLAETKPKDSWLRKYLFIPAGELSLPALHVGQSALAHSCIFYDASQDHANIVVRSQLQRAAAFTQMLPRGL